MKPFEFGRQRIDGLVPALVVRVDDPDNQARVLIELPWVADDERGQTQVWARLSTMMAGAGRGSFFVPEPGDEVVVGFHMGDPRYPIILGCLWNGQDEPPEQMDGSGENHVRAIHSRSGHKIRFVDEGGQEKVEVESQGGHSIVLDDSSSEVVITASSGATVTIDAGGTLTISAVAEVKIDAPAGMTVTAPKVKVDAALSDFTGMIKAPVVKTDSVISTSYTTGAGNVW